MFFNISLEPLKNWNCSVFNKLSVCFYIFACVCKREVCLCEGVRGGWWWEVMPSPTRMFPFPNWPKILIALSLWTFWNLSGGKQWFIYRSRYLPISIYVLLVKLHRCKTCHDSGVETNIFYLTLENIF